MKNDSTFLPNQNIADSKLVSIFKGVQETEDLVSKMQKIPFTYSQHLMNRVGQNGNS
jgi:hypothetical protein